MRFYFKALSYIAKRFKRVACTVRQVSYAIRTLLVGLCLFFSVNLYMYACIYMCVCVVYLCRLWLFLFCVHLLSRCMYLIRLLMRVCFVNIYIFAREFVLAFLNSFRFFSFFRFLSFFSFLFSFCVFCVCSCYANTQLNWHEEEIICIIVMVGIWQMKRFHCILCLCN